MAISTVGTYMNPATVDNTKSTTKTEDKSSLDMDDFLQLLSAQLRYQDMSNPMDNSAMMQQLTQMASITSMNTMTSQMDSILEISTISYAASMIGRELTVVTGQDSTTGELTTVKGTGSGVGFYDGEPCVFIDGTSYPLSSIMTMGDTIKVSPDTGTV
jgi:flagellar basal-body rod modification protein FlgD